MKLAQLEQRAGSDDREAVRACLRGLEGVPEAVLADLLDCLDSKEGAASQVAAAPVVLDRAATQLEAQSRTVAAALVLAMLYRTVREVHVFGRLVALLERLALFEDVLALYRERLGAEVNRPRRQDLYLSIARVLEEKVMRHDEAAAVFRRAVEEFPESPPFWTGLSRCLEATRQFDELIAVIERQLLFEKREATSALLHTRLASLLDSVRHDEQAALAHYTEAIRLAPGFEPPVHGLLALAEKLGSWPALVHALRSRMRTETRPRERATLLTRLGQVLAEHLGDVSQATACLEQALREYPRALQARLHLLELLCKQKQFVRAERFATPPQPVDGLPPAQLARLCEIRAQVAKQAGREVEAIECLCLGLEVSPEPGPLLDALLTLIEAEDPVAEPPESLSRLAHQWEQASRLELAAAALVALGGLRQRQGRLADAQLAFRRALGLLPGYPRCVHALACFFVACREFEAAIEVLVGEAAPATREYAEFVVRAASLAADHLKQPERALAMLGSLDACGQATAQSALWRARLALSLGRWAEASLALEQADQLGLPDTAGERWGLHARLWSQQGADDARVREARLEAVRAGHARSAAELAAQLDGQGVARLLAEVDGARRSIVAEAAAQAFLARGRREEAASLFRKAIDESAGRSLAAIEGLASLDVKEAVEALSKRVGMDPFNPRALALLSSLLTAVGPGQRARNLYELSAVLSGIMDSPSVPNGEQLWKKASTLDPLFLLLRQLRQVLPLAFEVTEQELANQCVPANVPGEVQARLDVAATARGLAPIRIRSHAMTRTEPLVLEGSSIIAVPRVLFEEAMPAGALLFASLRGLALLGEGLGSLTYLPVYQLDAVGEALSLLAGGEDGVETVARVLSVALERPHSEVLAALGKLDVPSSAAGDPLLARAALERRILHRVLSVTRDLGGALAAIASAAPPPPSFGASRLHWLRRLSRLPQAWAAVSYTLSDEYGKLTQADPGTRT